MIITVSEEGINLVENLISLNESAAEEITEASTGILALIDEYEDEIGPHVDALREAIQNIINSINDGTESVLKLVLALKKIKARYEEELSRTPTYGYGGRGSR